MSNEPLLPIHNNNDDTPSPELKVIFSDDTIQPLNINISTLYHSENIKMIDYKWLRRNIRSLRSRNCNYKSLKFLKNGVYINEETFQSSLVKYLNDNDFQTPFFIHCNIGIETLTLEELKIEDERDNQLGSNRNNNGDDQEMGAIGFDRLRGLGFSEDEIGLLRQQFQATYGENVDNNNVDNQRIRELEEQWMENDVRDDDEQFNSIPIGNFKHNCDLLIGITIGFTLGIFSLILIRQDGLFNRRQIMSIYAGIMINIIICFTRL